MTKRVHLFCILLFICSNVMSQTETMSVVQQINQIKRSPDEYIYAEGTSKNWEEALDNAKTLLATYIEVWAKSVSLDDDVEGYITKSNEHLFEIKAMRGQLYRAFVYVKKKDMIPYTQSDKLIIVPVQQESEVKVSLVTIDSNEDGGVDSKPDFSEDDSNEPIQSDADQTETPIANNSYLPTIEEQRILQVKQANQINEFIRQMQAENRIASYGKYNNMPNDQDCYLLVYDKDGNLPAHLHKINGYYFNMNTATTDNITNYKGCGAFWFILK